MSPTGLCALGRECTRLGIREDGSGSPLSPCHVLCCRSIVEGCWWRLDNLDALACFCVTLRASLHRLCGRELRIHEPPVQFSGFVAGDETGVGVRTLQKETFCRTAKMFDLSLEGLQGWWQSAEDL